MPWGGVKTLALQKWSIYSHFMEIAITQFKAKCLGIISEVERTKRTVVIKRHGHPAALLTPVPIETRRASWGQAAKTTHLHGDIFSTGENWNAP